MAAPVMRKRRILRALTPRRIRRAQARWRRRKQKAAKRYKRFREVVRRDPMIKCGQCGQLVPQPKLKTHLDRHAAHADRMAQRRRVRNQPKARTAPPPRPACDGTCTNSDVSPSEAQARGLCGWCAGRKELVTNFGGKHKHVPCGQCSATGKHTAPAKTGNADTAARRGQATRVEAGAKAAPWFGIGSTLMSVFSVFGHSPWFAAAGAGAMAVGGLAYRHERRHGTSGHADQAGRKAARRAAREVGCSAACMWSLKPADTCRCPCGGATHGAAHKRREAA
jgi:hypothetical protein